MIIHIPILTCKVCKCQFAKSRRIRLRNGVLIVRFETRSKYCSGACCAKAYRMNKAYKSAHLIHLSA